MATSRKSRRKPQVGQITDPLPIPPSSILRLPSLLQPPQFQPFPFLLLFPLPLNVSLGRSALSSPYCPAKMATSRKSWRGPNTTGPHDFLSGERAVARTILTENVIVSRSDWSRGSNFGPGLAAKRFGSVSTPAFRTRLRPGVQNVGLSLSRGRNECWSWS